MGKGPKDGDNGSGAKSGAKSDSGRKSAPKTEAKSKSKNGAGVSEDAVADWLDAHPDFLRKRPGLVRRLAPPSRFDGMSGDADDDGASRVIDMQGFMVSRLQADLARVRDSQNKLIRSARSNLASQSQVHKAVLTMLAADGLTGLIATVNTDLPPLLELTALSVCIEESETPVPATGPGLILLPPDAVTEALGKNLPFRLRADSVASSTLFGRAGADVRSDALVRLQLAGAGRKGMLALGSGEAGRFHPDQGMELLRFLAAALALLLTHWLGVKPPPPPRRAA